MKLNAYLWESWQELWPAFCKVEFLCHRGEPNWLAYLFLVWVAWRIGWGVIRLWIFFKALDARH